MVKTNRTPALLRTSLARACWLLGNMRGNEALTWEGAVRI